MLIRFHLTLQFLQVNPGERVMRGRLASHTDQGGEQERSGRGGARPAAALVPKAAGRGRSLLLIDGLLVSMPSIALRPRGSQHKRDFLGLSALLFLHSDFQALLLEQNCK